MKTRSKVPKEEKEVKEEDEEKRKQNIRSNYFL